MRKPSRGDAMVRGNDRWPTGRLDLRVVLVFGVDSVSCNWGGLHPAARCGLRAQSREILLGLTVVRLETGRPGSARDSVSRNVIFLLPGANVAAVFLEARTLSRDQQGLRLGDRLAMTQVVDGYGARIPPWTFKRCLKTQPHSSAYRLDVGGGEPPRASIAPHERSTRADH